MSGDVQTRQRRKEKKKQKREDDISTVPGVDTSKFNEAEKKTVQMHIQENDHHGDHVAGICAKIVFFSLMAILLGLVTLIVLENRGGSDVDTPLSKSRFSEYLQGWVEENREEEHHEESHFASVEDDEHSMNIDSFHEENQQLVPDDAPYPEEKDVSNPDDDDHEDSQELNAEINNNDSEPKDEDQNDNNDNDDDDDDNTQELDQDSENQKQADDNVAEDNNQQTNNDDDDDEDNENDVPNIFEDSAPFDEEETMIRGDHLMKQVDELYDTYNEIAQMLGKDNISTNNAGVEKTESNIIKGDNDEDNANSQENIENVVDNDAGEELLLQKLAEESETAQQQSQENNDDEQDQEEESSLMVKLGVGALLALVAHQIIIKKISATNRIDSVLSNDEDLLSKRRFTVLTSSEEQLVSDENIDDNEEIIEVMMISRSAMVAQNDEEEIEGEYSLEEEEEEDDDDDDDDDNDVYSEEIIDESAAEIRTNAPQTFEEFENMYRSKQEQIDERKCKVLFDEMQTVPERKIESEMEERISDDSTKFEKENVIEQKDSEEKFSPYDYESDAEVEEEELMGEEEVEEEEEPSGEGLLGDEELDYYESEEDISEIDDTDLMKRLEAKYGKIDDRSPPSVADDDESSWIKLPESGGAQSYMEELLRHQALEQNPIIKELYEKVKTMDAVAEREKSNRKLLEAIEGYKELINVYGDKINDTIFKEVAERCIERMRFMGKLKQTVDIHYKLIHRFIDDPSYRNQLAVTYLLGNRLSAAKLVLHETLSEWRDDGFALVHYGYVLKNLDKDYENAVIYLREGIESNQPGTQDGRFYYNLGDALQRLGRQEEAFEVYKKGAKIGIFLSAYQRSLYNVDRLKSKTFWTKVETTYKESFTEIHRYWQIIRDEGLKLLSQDGLFMNEQENLKDKGDWKQFELFAQGAATRNCHMAPITCKLIHNFKAASTCKRGQVKFSVLHPNTHVHSHCGPTNCRIRAHLGLKVPENTFLRVVDEIRSWKDGEWLIFDDSFEHEVWHNGTSVRLVLIVDVWHPDLTEEEKQILTPI